MTTISPYLTQNKLNQLTDRHVHLPVPSRTHDLTDGWINTATGDQRSWDVTDGVVGVLGQGDQGSAAVLIVRTR